jgi:membrane-associated protease RseP (regulator of RpoE activity)
MTAEERAGSFHHKKVGPRAANVAAGPFANFLLAIVIFTCLFTFFGKPSTSARVDKVEAGSAAAAAGFQPGDVVTERVDPATAAWLGVKETWFVVDRTLAYIGGVFTGREAADQVGGPLRIAQISGQVATIGLAALVHLAAVLSISIGLLNLFPVPLLDGGHLLFYAVEAVRGRPLSERAQEMGFRIGLGLVLMLMVFATYNDILHLAAS